MKKITALLLALLTLMSVVSFGAAAQTDYNYTISTKFYGYDGVDDNWKPITTVAAGDAVKMRVSISTNFNSGPAMILLAYDKSVLAPIGLVDGQGIILKLNSSDFASDNFRQVKCADGASTANLQLGKGNITAEQMEKYGFLAISVQTYACLVYDGSDWIFEVDMEVLSGSKGKSLECFVIPETVCTVENTEGFVSFPYADPGETDLMELLNAYLWYEGTPTLESHKAEVTEDNTVQETYEVKFIVDESVYDTAYFAPGASLTYPEAPEKEGYEFKGWVNEDGATFVAMPPCDIELFAQYEAEKHTFVFDATQGGCFESNGQRTVTFVYEYGETPEIFDESPVYPGMEFIGWDIEIPDIVTEDIIFTAEYVDIEYLVEFVDEYGNVIDESFYRYDDKVYETDVPEGYKAENAWYIGSKDNIVTFPYTVKEDVTFLALNEANVYNATFDAGEGVFADGTSVKVVPTVYGEEIAIPESPAREGYVFVMWDPEPGIIDMEDVYFEAIYEPAPDQEPEEVVVTFVDSDGDVIDEIFFYYGDKVYENDIPYGYKAENAWYIDDPANIVEFPYTVTKDVVMKAFVEADVYNAIFDAGEGEFADGSKIKVVPTKSGEEIQLPEEPAREGYTFVMWDPEPAVIDGEDQYFVAIYEANEVTITFADTGDTIIEPITGDYGTPVPEIPEPVKQGYTFVGWDTPIPKTMPAEDMVITAMWATNRQAVTFVNYDGSVIMVVEGDLGSDLIAPDLPVEEGYTYKWDKEVPATIPAETMTITAVRTPNKYNAVFDADGGEWADGSSVKSVSVAFDSAITAPESPVKDGYAFAGWSVDGVNAVNSLGVMDSVKGKEFVALWTSTGEATYAVETYTMNTSGAYQISGVNYQGKIGETVTASYNVPYGFSLNSAKSVLSGAVAADGSLVLKVYIDRNKHAFTTVVDGVRTSEYYIYGEEIDMPAEPAKAGYVFVGWDKSFPSVMPAEDITVTAVFRAAATIKIKNNPTSRTINYGETLRLTAEVENLPEGASVKWITEGSGFSVKTSGDGMTCELKSTGKGTMNVTAVVVGSDGNVITDSDGNDISDSQEVKSKAGIWQKIVSFFKNLFGMNRTIIQVFKIW